MTTPRTTSSVRTGRAAGPLGPLAADPSGSSGLPGSSGAPRSALSRRALLAASATGAVGLALAACGSQDTAGSDSRTVTVVTHDSFSLPDELVAAFEESSGYTLEIVPSGDGGELVNKLVLTKDAPLGDAVFGVDNSFASRVLDEGVIDTAVVPALPAGAEQYVVGQTPALAPIDFGEVSVNVDAAWFDERGLTPPATFEDLTRPDYEGLFVAINPTTSSTGLAFLLATIGHFGTDEATGFAQYWKDLMANGATIDEGWSDAYYTDFSGAGEGGTHPVVVSYSSSPAATLTDDGSASTTASLPATATRQVEYAGVLAGAANPEGARAFIEWLLSAEVQTAIPETMYMYPVNPEASLSEEIEVFGALSEEPIVVAAEEITANREAWLATWSEAVGA